MSEKLAAAFFRRQKLLIVSFLLVLAAGVTYAILSPSYQAEMKVMVRRGRLILRSRPPKPRLRRLSMTKSAKRN
jgi:uncharacterized protein involved in exopolysaccharide biosynthesis